MKIISHYGNLLFCDSKSYSVSNIFNSGMYVQSSATNLHSKPLKKQEQFYLKVS